MATLKPTRGNHDEETKKGPSSVHSRGSSKNKDKREKKKQDENYGFKYLHNEELA